MQDCPGLAGSVRKPFCSFFKTVLLKSIQELPDRCPSCVEAEGFETHREQQEGLKAYLDIVGILTEERTKLYAAVTDLQERGTELLLLNRENWKYRVLLYGLVWVVDIARQEKVTLPAPALILVSEGKLGLGFSGNGRALLLTTSGGQDGPAMELDGVNVELTPDEVVSAIKAVAKSGENNEADSDRNG